MIFRKSHIADRSAIERLHKVCFAPSKTDRAVTRLRFGRLPMSEYCIVAETEKQIIGSIDFYAVALPSGRVVPLLGPVMVSSNHRGKGLGRALVERGLRPLAKGEYGVLIVGVEQYYNTYGFQSECTKNLKLKGDITPFAFMGLEFTPHIFASETGEVSVP